MNQEEKEGARRKRRLEEGRRGREIRKKRRKQSKRGREMD